MHALQRAPVIAWRLARSPTARNTCSHSWPRPQVRIVKHAFDIIHLLTDQNPIQVVVDAIINRWGGGLAWIGRGGKRLHGRLRGQAKANGGRGNVNSGGEGA